MDQWIKTEELMTKNHSRILKGAKVPHLTSMPVLRKVDECWKLALFVQIQTPEQIREGISPRPDYWYTMNLLDGGDFCEFACSKTDFSRAPKGYATQMGAPRRKPTRDDAGKLYELLDVVRMRYMETGVIDAFTYREYQNLLYELVPQGQLNYYHELTKLI